MDKAEFMARAERAYDTRELHSEKIFISNFFNFIYNLDIEMKTCTIECEVIEPMLNVAKNIHGGILTYIADMAMGHLAVKVNDSPYVSLEFKTSFLKGESSGKITALAKFVREGRKVSFLECQITNEAGELLSVTTGTFYRVQK